MRIGVDMDQLHPNCTGAPNSSCTPFPFDGSKLLMMRWPAFSHMTDRQITAIYEYLSAVPCIQGADTNETPNRCTKSSAVAFSPQCVIPLLPFDTHFPLTLPLSVSSYESPGDRKWWARACAGVEAAAVSADNQDLLCAGEWRHQRRGGVCPRRSEEPGVAGGSREPVASGPDRGWPRAAAANRRGGRVQQARVAGVWPHQSGSAARDQQELCKRVHAAAPHSHGA